MSDFLVTLLTSSAGVVLFGLSALAVYARGEF